MYMNAYHKVQGEVRMFEVDARNAIARFPEEWAAEPWTDEDAASSATTNAKKIQMDRGDRKAGDEASDTSASEG